MEISNGRLGYTQDLDNQRFLNALRQSNRGVTDFNAHLQSNFNQSLISVDDLVKGVTAFLTIDMARDFVTQMVKIRGEFEQTEIAFNTMLQSREKGNALMKEMVDLAKNTPMQFSEVSKGAKQLLAYQVETEKLTETLSMLGDISSGLGVPLSRLILVYGQVKAKGRLMGDDLRQFTEAGVPMIAMIAKNMGVAQSAVADMVSEGKVGFKEVEKVLQDLTSQGGLFYNMMEEQSKTIPGQIAKLQDEIEQMFNNIGKDSQGFVSDVIGGASTIVENYEAIGSVLEKLVIGYGVYRAALIATSVIESYRSKTLATEIASLGISEKMQLGRAAVSVRQAEALKREALAENELAISKVRSMQAGKSAQLIKYQEALASLNAAHASKIQAETEVAAATVKYNALRGSHFIKREQLALQELEIAQTNLVTQTQNVNSASIALNTEQKNLNVVSTELLNATLAQSTTQTSLDTARRVENEAVTNLQTVSNTRLTTAQSLRVIATTAAARAEAILNATMLNNPVVLLSIGFIAFTAILYKVITALDATEKAQQKLIEVEGEAQKSIASEKLELERLIEIAKDDKKSKEEREKAIDKLNEKSPEYLGNLTLEKINTQEATKAVNDYTDALYKNAKAKAMQISYEKLVADEQDIWSNFYKNSTNPDLLQRGSNSFWKMFGVETKKIKNETDLRNHIIELYGKDAVKNAKIYEENVNRYLKSIGHDELASLRTQRELIGEQLKGMTTDLEGESDKKETVQTKSSVKNKAYWEEQKKQASDARDALASSAKGGSEWNRLTKQIDEANNALQAYNDSYKKPKKEKDPVEIYKKQVSEIEKQYEQYLKILDSNDVTFATEKAILKAQLESKGASYEEYLRAQQKELVKTAKTSDVSRKKLLLINEELLKLSKHSELQIFKDEFEKQLDDLDSVIEKLYEVQDLKESLIGKSDPLSIKKIEFIDEKQKELLKDSENAARSLFKTLTDESKPLDAINKKFDAQLFLLKKKINDANEEISKLTISAKSSPEGSNERIKIEEQILKLKKEILDTQNLIDFNESKRTVETKNVTNNTDYNKLLSEYQSYEDKIKAIDDKMNADLLTNQTYYETQKKSLIEQGKLDEIKALEDIKNAKDVQIKKQASDDTSDIAKNQLMGTEEWANLFSNMDEMTFQQIDNLIKQIEGQFNQLKGKFNPIDLKVILKQLNQAKNLVIEKNPFGSLAVGLADLFKGAEEETNSSAEGITTKWNRVAKSLTGTFDFINDAIDSAGVLKEFLGETASSAMETTQTVLGIGSSVLAVSQMTTEGIKGVERASVILAIISAVIQIATKIAKLLSNIFSKDKKKQKEINKHKEAVDKLTKSYKDLEDATKRALGSDVYSGQKQMIDNLKQQQIEYQKMIELEKRKKKKDNGKIKEWEDALRDSKNTIQDILEEITEDVVQTNAKDLASELGDALVEAFGKGEDAAKAFAEVANNVLKNAVLNQLKKQFLEKQLQSALDKLYKDMGGDNEGNFNFNGLSPEEQQEFRDKIKEISQNFSSMLGEYSDLFKDIIDPNETAMAGAIKGMSEETGNALLGQFNAMRIHQKELVTINLDSNKILLNSLDRLANIDYNTRSVLPLLEKLINRIDNAGRAYGF
ncbi:tape measure protein [Algoriella sp.]|uniref:tape measure protein n=1 Tax=Algoriella sp. TaxID=1872434 RepID=UPI002FC6CDA5